MPPLVAAAFPHVVRVHASCRFGSPSLLETMDIRPGPRTQSCTSWSSQISGVARSFDACIAVDVLNTCGLRRTHASSTQQVWRWHGCCLRPCSASGRVTWLGCPAACPPHLIAAFSSSASCCPCQCPPHLIHSPGGQANFQPHCHGTDNAHHPEQSLCRSRCKGALM